MFHISDIRKFERCHRYYYAEQREAAFHDSFLRNDESMTDLLVEFFAHPDCFVGKRGDEARLFFENEHRYDYFFNVRFEAGEMRIKVPVLIKGTCGYHVYFVHHGTSVRELDYYSLSIAYQVLLQNNLKVSKIYMISFNPDYVFHNRLEVGKLFVISDSFRERPIIDLVISHPIDYEKIIAEIKSSSYEESLPIKGRNCHLKVECPHYHDCFGDEEIRDDSIMTLVSSRYKKDMQAEGIERLADVDTSRLEGNRVQYAQVMASRNGGQFVDKLALRHFLSSIPEGNASFIDFEWDRYLVPPFEGMKPLDVVCFEFALYYLDDDQQLQNYTFIGTKDCRKEFVEEILRHLPEKGAIFAYNAEGAEVLRLKELGKIFPEYNKELNKIIARFVDLATPFVEGLVYDVRMAGNYSLKKLVSVVSEYSYRNLDINDGMKAVYSWRNVDKGNLEDSSKVLADLKEYCSLDAYGLLLVYRWLISLVA